MKISTGLRQAVIEISTPSYAASGNKDYWASGKNSPFKAPNCVPTDKKQLVIFKPYLDKLQDLIEQSKDNQNSQPTRSLPDEIEKLQQLRKNGQLTDAEFQQAKAKLLS